MLPRKSTQRQKKKAAKKRQADKVGPYSTKHVRKLEARLAATTETKPIEQPQPKESSKGAKKAKR